MYLLGLFTRKCSSKGFYIGIGIGVFFILWAYFSNAGRENPITWLPRFSLHTLWIGLLGNLVVFVTGFSASRLLSPKYNAKKELTVYQRSIQTEGKKCDE